MLESIRKSTQQPEIELECILKAFLDLIAVFFIAFRSILIFCLPKNFPPFGRKNPVFATKSDYFYTQKSAAGENFVDFTICL